MHDGCKVVGLTKTAGGMSFMSAPNLFINSEETLHDFDLITMKNHQETCYAIYNDVKINPALIKRFTYVYLLEPCLKMGSNSLKLQFVGEALPWINTFSMGCHDTM